MTNFNSPSYIMLGKTYDDRSTQTDFDPLRGSKRHRCNSSTDDDANKENLAINSTCKPKRIRRDQAVILMRNAFILSQEAVKLSQEVFMLLAENSTYH
jgi:hypothetical protein